MRSSEDVEARQLEALSNFLAFTPRDPSLSLSEQIERDAAAGDIWAGRVLKSRILESPQSAETAEPIDDLADAPPLSIAVAAQSAQARKQVRNAALGIVNRRSVVVGRTTTPESTLRQHDTHIASLPKAEQPEGWHLASMQAERS
jgi:hypothetical protein